MPAPLVTVEEYSSPDANCILGRMRGIAESAVGQIANDRTKYNLQLDCEQIARDLAGNIIHIRDHQKQKDLKGYITSMQVNHSWNDETETKLIVQSWGSWNTEYEIVKRGSAPAQITRTVRAPISTSTDPFLPNPWPHWNVEYNERTTGLSGHIHVNASTIDVHAESWGIWNEKHVIRADQILVQRRVREEERRRWQEQENRQRHLREEAERERQEAIARAEKLLKEHLNEDQRNEYERHGLFHVYVGEKKYRIRKGWAGNVELVDAKKDDRRLEQFCIHPCERIPEADNLLAQKLLLESNEQEFRRIANVTRLYH